MPITYDIGGIHYPSQASLERAVKERLRGMRRNEPVSDRFLQEIVNTLHPDVCRSEHKSDGRFRLLTWQTQRTMGLQTAEQFRGGELLQTYFIPLGRWHDVTVYPWKRPPVLTQIVAALRAKASAFIPSPDQSDHCAVSGCAARGYELEYHHVWPTFAQIIETALKHVSEQERAAVFGYDKFADGCYTLADFIPDDHPAVLVIGDAHHGNTWAWLCKRHHAEAGYGGDS